MIELLIKWQLEDKFNRSFAITSNAFSISLRLSLQKDSNGCTYNIMKNISFMEIKSAKFNVVETIILDMFNELQDGSKTAG